MVVSDTQSLIPRAVSPSVALPEAANGARPWATTGTTASPVPGTFAKKAPETFWKSNEKARVRVPACPLAVRAILRAIERPEAAKHVAALSDCQSERPPAVSPTRTTMLSAPDPNPRPCKLIIWRESRSYAGALETGWLASKMFAENDIASDEVETASWMVTSTARVPDFPLGDIADVVEHDVQIVTSAVVRPRFDCGQ
eukprot:2855290-Rhodomonas_salina.3